MERLSLLEALACGRLDEFVQQAGREGVGQVSSADFEAALAGLIALQLEDFVDRCS